jgi:YebC/PmpR family DNA-binding regulatory protein
MSGHSKWASIKHKKAVVDARRGAHFTKLARAITVAARDGGGDPDANSTLALAVQKARDASMPKDNIERAIAKGTGAGAEAAAIDSVVYEGYGPGGVALLVEALTDNRNRTGAEIRHLLSKHGANLGEPGSVSYLFDKKGVVVVDAGRYSEDDLMPAIDAGAEDIRQDDDVLEIVCAPQDLEAVRGALEAAGVEVDSAEVVQLPRSRVPLDDATAARLLALIDALEDNDDVDAVHANYDVDAGVLERAAG